MGLFSSFKRSEIPETPKSGIESWTERERHVFDVTTQQLAYNYIQLHGVELSAPEADALEQEWKDLYEPKAIELFDAIIKNNPDRIEEWYGNMDTEHKKIISEFEANFAYPIHHNEEVRRVA
ncbi:MAG: hypothetical protein JWL80_454 [Parcubacteria group bacterium]|nr:hypothetical protein [Parcubacteria group bacterium]